MLFSLFCSGLLRDLTNVLFVVVLVYHLVNQKQKQIIVVLFQLLQQVWILWDLSFKINFFYFQWDWTRVELILRSLMDYYCIKFIVITLDIFYCRSSFKDSISYLLYLIALSRSMIFSKIIV